MLIILLKRESYDFRIDPDAFDAAQEIFYRMQGWDQNGVPTQAALAALDLEWARPLLTV